MMADLKQTYYDNTPFTIQGSELTTAFLWPTPRIVKWEAVTLFKTLTIEVKKS
jgi:hypothetical protein